MKKLVLLLLACLFAVGGAAAFAEEPRPTVEEVRLGKLASELRCLVCQNQTIADSNADLAVDLRREIREQIQAGRSDGQIIDYMVARYGEFVLYRPPFRAATWLLWLGPALLLLLGVLVLRRSLRNRGALVEDGPLDEAERERAAALLAMPDRKD